MVVEEEKRGTCVCGRVGRVLLSPNDTDVLERDSSLFRSFSALKSGQIAVAHASVLYVLLTLYHFPFYTGIASFKQAPAYKWNIMCLL